MKGWAETDDAVFAGPPGHRPATEDLRGVGLDPRRPRDSAQRLARVGGGPYPHAQAIDRRDTGAGRHDSSAGGHELITQRSAPPDDPLWRPLQASRTRRGFSTSALPWRA